MRGDTPQGPNGRLWDDDFDPSSLIGWLVGDKYRIVRHIGGGGFGEVYEALNTKLLDQRVVVKFLKQAHSRQRFEREAQILCRLDHPNICRVIDYFPNERALAMLFIDARDVDRLIQNEGPLNDELILKIATSVTDAVTYAHSKNIAHRDVKPKNILVDKFNHVYLIDFGIAKELDATSLTGTGHMVLTPQFAAPERLNPSQPYDPFLSDVYEIGATICKITSDLTPFELTQRNLSGAKGSQHKRRLSRSMRHVLSKATQAIPSERYQSAEELGKAFRRMKRVYAGSRLTPTIAVAAAIAGAVWLTAASGVKIQQLWPGFFHTAASESDTLPTPIEPVIGGNDTLAPHQTPLLPPAAEKTDTPRVEEAKPLPEPRHDSPPPPPKEKPSVPTRPTHRLTISADPSAGATITVDGKQCDANSAVQVEPGEHVVKIVQPDFPIYIDTLNVQGDRAVPYSLPELFAARTLEPLFFGGTEIPQGSCLRVSLNGGADKTLCAFIGTSLPVRRGRWLMRFLVSSGGRTSPADSFLIAPVNSPERGLWYRGDSTEVDLDDPMWRGRGALKLVVSHRSGS